MQRKLNYKMEINFRIDILQDGALFQDREKLQDKD